MTSISLPTGPSKGLWTSVALLFLFAAEFLRAAHTGDIDIRVYFSKYKPLKLVNLVKVIIGTAAQQNRVPYPNENCCRLPPTHCRVKTPVYVSTASTYLIFTALALTLVRSIDMVTPAGLSCTPLKCLSAFVKQSGA